MENQSQSKELTIEKMLEKEHLLAAYQAVKANAGAPGIDGMTVERLGPHLREHWPRIAAKLREVPATADRDRSRDSDRIAV